MKILILLVLSLTLVACKPSNMLTADQCLRAELFAKCMASIPEGPSHVVNNDWDEVISECGSQSYYQSLRSRQQIKEECR